MFKDHFVGGGLTVGYILENSDSVFEHYMGSPPNEIERHHSPFRMDSNPGCRYDWEDTWKFVDNATYNGKLKFNAIEFVQHLHGVSFQEAINMINEEVKFKTIASEPKLFIPEIKVIPKELTKDNYFTRNYDIPVPYLRSRGVWGVERYYCNTRKHRYMKVNAYYSPKLVETYCYKINKKLELYFPDQEIKFVKATTSDDYYGPTKAPYIILVEGKKDQMILDYHFTLNAHGIHNVYHKPKLETKKVFVWLDPDEAGIAGAARLTAWYTEQGIETINITSTKNQYDIADLYKYNKQKLNEIINSIIGQFPKCNT